MDRDAVLKFSEGRLCLTKARTMHRISLQPKALAACHRHANNDRVIGIAVRPLACPGQSPGSGQGGEPPEPLEILPFLML